MGDRKIRILYRYCRIASSSAVDMEDEFLWQEDTMVYRHLPEEIPPKTQCPKKIARNQIPE